MQATADKHSRFVAAKHLCALIIHTNSCQHIHSSCSDMIPSTFWTKPRNHCCLTSVALSWRLYFHLFLFWANFSEMKLSDFSLRKPSLISLISMDQEVSSSEEYLDSTHLLTYLLTKSLICLFRSPFLQQGNPGKTQTQKVSIQRTEVRTGSLGEIQQKWLSSQGSG